MERRDHTLINRRACLGGGLVTRYRVKTREKEILELCIWNPSFPLLTSALLFPALLGFQHVNCFHKADENDPLSTGDFGAGI